MGTETITFRTTEAFRGAGRYEVDLDGDAAGWVVRSSRTAWRASMVDDYGRVRHLGTFRTRIEAAREVRIHA